MTPDIRVRMTTRKHPSARMLTALPLLGLLAACTEPLDFDLRGQIGAFNTTESAQKATAKRPRPDARGLITYPNYQVAVARRGDTVADVAARVGIPAKEIAAFNGVQPTDKLRADEVLVLPRKAPATGSGSVDIAALAGQAIDNAPDTTPPPGSISTSTLEPAPAAPAPKVQSGPEPVRHKVERGETAYTIARLYQVPVRSLAERTGPRRTGHVACPTSLYSEHSSEQEIAIVETTNWSGRPRFWSGKRGLNVEYRDSPSSWMIGSRNSQHK